MELIKFWNDKIDEFLKEYFNNYDNNTFYEDEMLSMLCDLANDFKKILDK